MEFNDDTKDLVTALHGRIRDEPGWAAVTDEPITLPDWYGRGLTQMALLCRQEPDLVVGRYASGVGVLHAFTDRRVVTLTVEKGDDPDVVSMTTTARSRADLIAVDLDAETPAFHGGFASDWPGVVEARLTYRDGTVVEFRRSGVYSTRSERFLTALPGILDDLDR